jgi:sugar/nucleoside kinase (ribokinase family)
MTSPVLLTIGSMNYDTTYVVDGLPCPHSKVRALDQWAGPGGSAANTAYLLGRTGRAVRMLGCVGEDPFGEACLKSLEYVGVDTSSVQKSKASGTGLCTIIILVNGEKRMISAGGANRELRFESVDPAICDCVDHIHVSSDSAEALQWAFCAADASGATVSLEWNGRDHRQFGRAGHLNFMNADELGRLTGAGSNLEAFSRELADGLEGWVVVTNGEHGSWATNGSDFANAQLPKKVVVMDRTGGGDAFDAGFLSAWKAGKSIQGCLTDGLLLAAEVLQVRGTRLR